MHPAGGIGGARWLRAGTGALLGVLLATLAWIVGIEQQGALATMAMIGVAAGPGFLMLGVALAIWMDGPGALSPERRLAVLLLGMAGSVSTLLGLTLVSTLFIGVYALLFAVKLLVPMLFGGLGVGLGCQIRCPCPRKETA
ncbi:MAG TPA: hypothetical protein VNM14_15540 [Planctomycetota bacterium]|jgi:hypothetical protein|nr:hypothetical protein [Planctomycetota bacterium]